MSQRKVETFWTAGGSVSNILVGRFQHVVQCCLAERCKNFHEKETVCMGARDRLWTFPFLCKMPVSVDRRTIFKMTAFLDHVHIRLGSNLWTELIWTLISGLLQWFPSLNLAWF